MFVVIRVSVRHYGYELWLELGLALQVRIIIRGYGDKEHHHRRYQHHQNYYQHNHHIAELSYLFFTIVFPEERFFELLLVTMSSALQNPQNNTSMSSIS